MKKIRAKEKAFHNGRVRKGQIIDVPDDMKLPAWFELVEEPEKKAPAKKKAAKTKEAPKDE